MQVSVIICTYNKCYLLQNTLDSIIHMSVPENLSWEVIVVDNDSSDGTKEMVVSYQFKNHQVPLRYVKEKNQGVAFARNRGVQESTGEVIAFIDDDEIVEPSWLSQMLKPFCNNHADCVGGKILVRYPESYEKPRWLLEELEGFIGKLDYGVEEILPLTDISTPIFTGNSAFSRKIFKEIGLFNTQLGRKGEQNFGGEDVEMFQRILNTNYSIFYQPKAIVHHVLDKDRLKKRYFRMLHFKEGMQKSLLDKNKYEKTILNIPFFIFPQFLRSIFKYLLNPTLRIQMNIWWFLGFMRGRITKYKADSSD